MNDEMLHKLRSCLATLPVEKAWLFGSYSRGEEHPDSDIDLLVRFDEEARISLFKYASIILTLEAAMGKDVDLVQEGSLLPFAAKTADEDKILIFWRSRCRSLVPAGSERHVNPTWACGQAWDLCFAEPSSTCI